MKSTLPLLLTVVSPLLSDPCCIPLQEPNCYPYAVNPPLTSNPCWVCGGRIDFLYWKPSVESNEFAQVIFNDIPFTTTSPSGNYSLQLKDFNYDFDGGFRLGVNVSMPGNQWRLNLDWTHYLHTESGSVFTNEPSTVALSNFFSLGSFGFQQSGFVFGQTSVDANWKIQLDLVDLIWNREFYVGHQVTLMPYGGLQALFLRQKVNSTNTLNIFLNGSASTLQTSIGVSTTDFKGVGIRSGLFSSWEFLYNLSFYGDVSASAIYGHSSSHLSGTATLPSAFVINSNLTELVADSKRGLNTVRGMLDLSFGFQWREYFFTQGGLLTLRAAWEQQIYLRQNTLPTLSFDQAAFNVNLNKAAGDITLQGLVVSANFTY